MEILGQILAMAGAAVFVIAGVGLLRLPDVYSRISAVTLAAELGTVLILVGALLLQPSVGNGIKAVAGVVLQAVGCAVGGMMLARAAYLTGTKLTERTRRDELAGDAEAERLPDRAPGHGDPSPGG